MREICPRCESTSAARILHGLIEFSAKLMEDIEEGRVELGGCCVQPEDRHCYACGYRWGAVWGNAPSVVVGADWGKSPKKQWYAPAVLHDGTYVVEAPRRPRSTESFFDELQDGVSDPRTMLVGFDFPIGLPAAYAAHLGVRSFPGLLPRLAKGKMAEWFTLSNAPSLDQPFYPKQPVRKGEVSKKKQREAMGLSRPEELLRRCDQETHAESLFWTLGPKQVGQAAISGWRDVIAPALDRIRLWPFDGRYDRLIAEPDSSKPIIVCEIYPAIGYGHLGFEMGNVGLSKRNREGRLAVVSKLLRQEQKKIQFTADCRAWIEDGFRGEDDFDAMVGLLSMLQVVRGLRTDSVPEDDAVKSVEGWIFGLKTKSLGRSK